MAHPADEARLYPHAVEILEYLKPRRLFVITNRYVSFADAVLNGLGIRGYFEEVVGGDDESCLKPSACVIDGVASRFDIDKSAAIIVGDMDVDIMAGKNSGIATCWVTHGLGKIEDIKHLKPDFIIEDLIELKEIIR
jgi:HAD superfamily hydrolase (TIGR01549 family)